MESASKAIATLRITASDVLKATSSFVDDPPGGEVDVGIGVLTGLISHLDGLRLRLLRQRGIVDRAVLSAELEVSRAEAAQVVKMIERLDGLAALQPAIENGLVSMSNARMIAEAITSTARREAATTDEAKLIELASTLTPVHLRRELDRWGRTIDQSVGDATAEDLRAQRSLEISKRASGMTEITARLDPESADLVATAIEARMKAEWDHETDTEHAARTATQRRADAFIGICADWLSGTATTTSNSAAIMRSRPHISVIVDLATLQTGTGVAVTERGTVLTAEAARRICCDAGISRIITNGPSQVIDVGREQRTFQNAARKVLTLRDRGCRFPGCNAPPSWCQAHHHNPWNNNGSTDTRNGYLLCTRHHHNAHEGGWTITGHPEGLLTFTSPTGLVLGSSPPGLAPALAA